MKQKITKLMVLALVLITNFSVDAYDFEVDGLYYTITSTSELTCKVDKGEVEYAGDIVVPSEVQFRGKTLKVTDIGTGFKGSGIISIDLTRGGGLANECFKDCDLLETVILSQSTKSIPKSSFYVCKSLKEISIPIMVEQIGENAFRGCENLKVINIPDKVNSLGDYSFCTCSNLEIVSINGNANLGRFTFGECKNLSKIELSEGICEISDNAFINCTNLKNIDLPKSLKKIGSHVFEGTGIELIEIPECVVEFNSDCFYNSNIRGLTIGREIDMFPLSLTIGAPSKGSNSAFSIELSDLFNYYESDACDIVGHDYFISYTSKNSCPTKNENDCWKSLRRLIIADSENAFNYTAAFLPVGYYGKRGIYLNCPPSLDYYYIGRPVKTGANKKIYGFTNGGNDYSFWLYGTRSMENVLDISEEAFPTRIKKLEFGGFCKKADLNYILSESIDTLKINSSVSLLSIYANQLNNLKKIEMCACVPPSLTINEIGNCLVSTETYLNLEIEVPKGCLEAYQKAEGWNKFWNFKEGDYEGQSGVADIEVKEPSKYEMARYDINGVPVSRDYRGLIIIKYSDGSSEKRFIK